MKKIALCLFGSIGFKQKPETSSENLLAPDMCYEKLSKTLLNNYLVDVFFHTWKSDYDEKIVSLYEPKKYLIEKQINFNTNLEDYSLGNIDFYQEIGDLKYNDQKPSTYLKNFIFRTKSRWHSQLTSLKLLEKYKKENDIDYDVVIQSRFDLLINKLELNQLDLNYINLVNAPHHKKNQLYDIFFISNYKNAIKFLNLENNLTSYPICPTNALPIFFKSENILIKKSLKFSDFIIHRNLYKYYKINISRKVLIFFIARITNTLATVTYYLEKIKFKLNKYIN